MRGWIRGLKDESGSLYEVDELVNGCLDLWIHRWMDGWMDGWMEIGG